MSVQIGGVAGFEHFLRRGIHKVKSLAQRIVGCEVGGNRRRAALAKVIELTRHNDLTDLDQSRQRHHLLIATAHEDFFNIVWRIAACRSSLHDHVILLAIALVARDVAPAQHGLHSAAHRIDAHAQISGFFPVNFKADLWLIQTKIRIHLQKAGVFGELILKLANHLRQIGVAVRCHDDEVHGSTRKALPERGRRDGKCGHTRQAGNARRHLARQIRRALGALIPRRGAEKHISLGHCGIACNSKDTVKLFVAATDALNGIDIAQGVVQRRPVRRVNHTQHNPAILHRSKFALNVFQNPPCADSRAKHD